MGGGGAVTRHRGMVTRSKSFWRGSVYVTVPEVRSACEARRSGATRLCSIYAVLQGGDMAGTNLTGGGARHGNVRVYDREDALRRPRYLVPALILVVLLAATAAAVVIW